MMDKRQVSSSAVPTKETKQPINANSGRSSSSNNNNNDDDDSPTTIFVISLQGVSGAARANDNRMDTFRHEWNQKCGNNSKSDRFVIEQCPGVLDRFRKRGYGVTTAFIRCLNRAIKTNQEMTMIFEDDARLFDSSFCSGEFRVDQFKRIPRNAFIVLLGGHTWTLPNLGKIDAGRPYRRLVKSYGAYGFAVPRANLELLRDDFNQSLINGGTRLLGKKTLAPDVIWYKNSKKRNMKVYALDPLVVWHSESYSNTWGKIQESIQSRKIVDSRLAQTTLNTTTPA